MPHSFAVAANVFCFVYKKKKIKGQQIGYFLFLYSFIYSSLQIILFKYSGFSKKRSVC